MPLSVYPLLYHVVVLVRLHCAPASLAPCGLIVTLKEPAGIGVGVGVLVGVGEGVGVGTVGYSK